MGAARGVERPRSLGPSARGAPTAPPRPPAPHNPARHRAPGLRGKKAPGRTMRARPRPAAADKVQQLRPPAAVPQPCPGCSPIPHTATRPLLPLPDSELLSSGTRWPKSRARHPLVTTDRAFTFTSTTAARTALPARRKRLISSLGCPSPQPETVLKNSVLLQAVLSLGARS